MAIKEEKTTQEIKNYALKQQALQEKFAQVKQAVQLIDLTKTETRTFTVFSKDKLRQYMQNPKTNESNLRNLSRFLYRVSHNYRRLISYQAEMVDLTALNVIPQIDFTEDAHDDEKIKTSYFNTLVQLDKMNMQSEILKCLLIAWREDTFYGYTYEDDSGFFIYPLQLRMSLIHTLILSKQKQLKSKNLGHSYGNQKVVLILLKDCLMLATAL